MIQRTLEDRIRTLLADYPAVALLGPRQAGKTTLAKSLNGLYFDIEKEQDRLRLDIEWNARIKGPEFLVLDEVQSQPELLSRLRTAIDEDRKRNGRFLLLGSVSPALMKQAGNALTGRLALCELSPLSTSELPEDRWDDLWRMGGYPDGGILEARRFPEWQNFYLELMAHRDLPGWGFDVQPAITLRLFKMLAAMNGQSWNASQVGQSLGLSYHTVNRYVDFLEHAYLIRRLPGYAANIRKRLIRAPKLHWRDTGLLHVLLGLGGKDDIYAMPWVGASWESWVIEQIIIFLRTRGASFQVWHFRTSDQHEIDMLLEYQASLWAIEVKLTSMPSASDLNRVQKVAGMAGAHRAILITRTTSPVEGVAVASVNLAAALRLLAGEPATPVDDRSVTRPKTMMTKGDNHGHATEC